MEQMKFRLGASIGEKLLIHRFVVEAGHRAAVQSQRTRRDDQVGSPQAAIAKRGAEKERAGQQLDDVGPNFRRL